MKNYLLITGTSEADLEAKTGLHGHMTPLGVLVEEPRPFRMEVEMEKLNRALHPRQCSCAVIHMPPCKFAFMAST